MIGLAPRDFYDMSLCEWTAAIEGLLASRGVDTDRIVTPATSDDFADFPGW